MDAISAPFREVAVPASIFGTLRRELAREVGDLPAIHALNAAGYASGVEARAEFPTLTGDDASTMSHRRFWEQLRSFFSTRGWGVLTHRDEHEAIGLLASSDWTESSDAPAGSSCSFTSGFLSGLLSEIAGGPVGVLEVECRGRGDDTCVFAFGSETAIHELYGALVAGKDLPKALESL